MRAWQPSCSAFRSPGAGGGTLVCLSLLSLGFAVGQLRCYHLLRGTALPIALL
ncbi:hypothetical protein [Streptomyces spirodelae]|uniref:Uncharacterized protein n=1 Tax=Streptomyces spirodelae TaxID=2812904 RepID=A0ABS3WQB4_9ACTN|nr:hypothetical protein [Streptomyces spirodelae]MBO8185311.1 hypothetical protein [Streptomyces spirodelae]